jgi:hypothetical protein
VHLDRKPRERIPARVAKKKNEVVWDLGFEVGRYISLERLIEENKERYYETLEAGSTHGTRDSTTLGRTSVMSCSS